MSLHGVALEQGRHRRRYTRYDLEVAIEVHGPGFTVACATDDVGAGGCSLRFEPAPPPDTVLDIRVSSHHAPQVPYGQARVAWASDGFMGLAFSHPLIQEMVPFLRTLIGEDEPIETPRGS